MNYNSKITRDKNRMYTLFINSINSSFLLRNYGTRENTEGSFAQVKKWYGFQEDFCMEKLISNIVFHFIMYLNALWYNIETK